MMVIRRFTATITATITAAFTAAFTAALMLWAQSAQAQDDALTDDQRNALFAEFVAVTFDEARAYPLNRALLADSFAAHLHADNAPQSVAEMSARYAAYDPTSDTALTAGMALYHLAYSNAILLRIGGSADEAYVNTIEVRILWLAGHTDLALELAQDTLAGADAAGMGNAEITSLLADAAVLAHRAGDTAAAQDYWARANACGVVNCPTDMIFNWIDDTDETRVDDFAAYDPQKMHDIALDAAAALMPGTDAPLRDIEREHALMSGDGAALIMDALALAQGDAETLTPDQAAQARRDLRQLAQRLFGAQDFLAYMMSGDSTAGHAKYDDPAWPDTRADIEEVAYLSATGLFDDFMFQTLPLIQSLIQSGADQAGRSDDAIVAELMRMRTFLAKGQHARALEGLQTLAATATAQGYSDAQIFSVLADLRAAAILVGETDLAVAARERANPCLINGCHADLMFRFLERATALPRMVAPDNLGDIQLTAADAYLRSHFPDDKLALADLYAVGVDGAQNRPMDAARLSLFAMEMVEDIADIDPAILVNRAASTMETLVYAGQYREAADLGDRVLARLDAANTTAAVTAAFMRFRARAAFWLDEAAAPALYARAVAVARSNPFAHEDLALDLLDTPHFGLIEDLVDPDYPSLKPAILARMRARQGRHADAADILAAARRDNEIYHTEAFDAHFQARIAFHLEHGPLDMVAALTTQHAQVMAGQDVPHDAPLQYAQNTTLQNLALQEATYRDAAGQTARAAELRALAVAGGPAAIWVPLDRLDTEATLQDWNGAFAQDTSYDYIRSIIEFRDIGNYEAAAAMLGGYSGLALAAEHNGTYTDAQTLWQMAFTYARVGESAIAFDLMNRAARIAATLSFEGAGGADGGTLQLLERDRWRYLLFVDIAWSAVSGQAPADMMVVSRY